MSECRIFAFLTIKTHLVKLQIRLFKCWAHMSDGTFSDGATHLIEIDTTSHLKFEKHRVASFCLKKVWWSPFANQRTKFALELNRIKCFYYYRTTTRGGHFADRINDKGMSPSYLFIIKYPQQMIRVQGVPQSQTAALPGHQEAEETDKTKQAQIEKTRSRCNS